MFHNKPRKFLNKLYIICTMSILFDQIKHLYDQCLYSNVISLANLVLSLSDHNNDLFTAGTKFIIYVYYADSHFHVGNYRKAESLYKKSLQFRKCLVKSKGSAKPSLEAQFSDVDIKFQIHSCLVKMNNSQEALQFLQTIPGKQRTAKVNMALAKMFQEQGMERSAIATYKEVLRECPLALEAAEGLLALGVKGIEVNSLIVGCTPNLHSLDWLNSWIKAHAHINNREYNHATTTLSFLDNSNYMRNNFNLLVTMGECYYYAGDDVNAIHCLKKARNVEPDMIRGLDILAAALHKTSATKELENLIPASQLSLNDCSAESYIVMSYASYATKSWNRANTFAAQALSLSPNNVEALILRGNLLVEQKKYTDALLHFRHATQLKPHRFDAHKGLVDCFVGMHRLREALNIASSCCKSLGHTPRVLTLYASVLVKDPVTSGRAKNLLQKALSQDEVYLPAALLLVEIYEQEMNLEGAISLLEKQVEAQPKCRLHQMLGDLWMRLHNEDKALDNYAIALNLEPNNRRVIEGMHRLDSSSMKLDTTFYEGEEQADTDNDAGDESETEAVWSDMDLEANSTA